MNLPKVFTNDSKLLKPNKVAKFGLIDFITIYIPKIVLGLSIENITALGIILRKSLLIATLRFKSIPAGIFRPQFWSLDMSLTNFIRLSTFCSGLPLLSSTSLLRPFNSDSVFTGNFKLLQSVNSVTPSIILLTSSSIFFKSKGDISKNDWSMLSNCPILAVP